MNLDSDFCLSSDVSLETLPLHIGAPIFMTVFLVVLNYSFMV